MKYALVITAALLAAPVSAQADDFSQFFNPDVGRQYARLHPPGRFIHRRVWASESANLLHVAQRYLGSRNFTGVGRWCRAAINHWAALAGKRLSNRSNRAVDALALGPHVSSPRPGDLAVMRHHVTIFAGWSGDRLIGLGGNQSRRVKYSAFSRRGVLAFIRL
jgi:hypothetical protein